MRLWIPLNMINLILFSPSLSYAMGPWVGLYRKERDPRGNA